MVFVSNYSQGWLNAKPFKVGDNVYSGMNLAEIPDMSSLAMDAKVEETDRGRIGVGKDVRVRVDALPELQIPAKITQISPLAELSFGLAAHAQLSRLCGAARLRPAPASRHERRHGHHHPIAFPKPSASRPRRCSRARASRWCSWRKRSLPRGGGPVVWPAIRMKWRFPDPGGGHGRVGRILKRRKKKCGNEESGCLLSAW